MAALGDNDSRWPLPCVETNMGDVVIDWFGDCAQHGTTYVHAISLWE